MGSLVLSLWASASLVDGAISWQEAVWAVLFGSAFLAVGAVLLIRRPGAVVGRICFLTGVTMAAAADLRTFSILLDRQPGPIPPAGAVAANVASIATTFAALILGAVLLARFPDGRDRGRLATIADITVVAATAGLVASLFVPGILEANWLRLPTQNPIGISALAGISAADLSNATLAVYGVSVIASAAVLVRRYRRSGPVVRAQVRWVAAAGIVPIILFVSLLGVGNLIPGGVGDALWSAWILSTTLLPIAIGIAILRYRLYDINRIVSRTITYTILTGMLGAAFVATVIGVSFTQGQTIAVAASTLVAFALFQPLRRRVQGVVDRRFDRARVDGERTAAEFRARLRHEVDISMIAVELLETIDASVKPSARSLWLRQAEP
jgi:hypothetical protein